MNDLLPITSALADPGRLRILACLRGGEVCACHIIELLALAPSTVSKHMAILRQAGLVEARKDGRWMHYRLAGPGAPDVVARTLEWLWECLDEDAQAAADSKRLKAITGMNPEVLCCSQRECGPGAAVPMRLGVKVGVKTGAGSGSSSSAPGTRAAARSHRAGRGRSRRA